MNDLALKLFEKTLEIKGVSLNPIQTIKFQHACEKSIIENPTLNFNDLLNVTQVYLNFILDFPDLQL